MVLLFTLTRTLTIAGFMACCAASWAAQSPLEQYQAQFNHEKDPVRRAKLMPKLGRAEFEVIRRDLAAGNYDDAVKTVQALESESAEVEDALEATGIDAEKNPSGFKEFQISVRSNIDRLNDLMAGMTADEQPPFGHARKELQEIDRALIQRLFPRQPKAESEHGKAKPD
ncbi:MAG: hypothetical protein WB795_07930 [Candidatus Acidiferrales bacterium]|jgi:hypothetical protein